MRTVIIFCLCLSAFAAQAQNDVNYTYMDSLFQQLPEVLVKGERPVVKAERGKLVYDLPRMVERLPVNNAYEAVKELPGIVEQDGNLTLGGRSITLVINGKVSTLDKEDLRTVLENTPVSRLEKAEIMYAAPARYRIRGAMVNVILKSNIGQKPALSGEVAAMYEQSRREDITGRGNLLYTSRRFSADVMYSYGFKHTTFGLDKHSWHTMAGEVHELDLKTEAKGYGGRHNLRLGADYDFGKKNLLSVVYNTQYRYGQDCTKMRGTAHSDKTDDGSRQLHNVTADYQSSFGLSAGMDFLFFSSPSQTFLQKDMQSVRQTLNYDSNQRINRWLFYANQLHSLQGGTEINYGVKYTTTHDNSYQFYRDGETGALTPDNSEKLLRKEYTLNMYTGASHSFGKKFSAEVSLAAELYHAEGRHSWMLYPTVNTTYTPADGHTLQMSFTSNRKYPAYWQLQPIIQYVDSYTEAHGNPDLKPSSNYSLDLNYLYKNKYMIGVNYNYTPDYFVQLPYQLPDRLAEMNQFVNYDFQKRWTIQTMASYKVSTWWNGRIFAFGLFSHDKNSHFHDIAFDRHKFSVILNTTNTFILSKKPDIIGTLAGFYQSRAIQGVYNLSPICNISTSLQWTSPDGKTKVILKGNDILNTSNMTTRLAWGQQRNRTEMNWDNRSFTFSFLYKFGGYKEKKRTDVDTKRLGR
ncbi:outer membrane beta-barrel family protein [Phocaeicola dorei]|uniref:Outer membrane protein beta-barrel domain-containing protein n=1 Tax=Phocaeicola dorei CL03T12C01 TaxID=997877 RepID=I9FSS5_9BACT|nr:hypothetical protein HMPREF1065_02681 [Phocaeicola dorei CL03T12C01]